MDVPVIIAVTTKLTPGDDFREEEDYATTVCSLHNLVLSLWSRGIGQWSTGGITRHQSTYKNLGISETQERIIGFVKVGYPESIPGEKKVDECDCEISPMRRSYEEVDLPKGRGC